MKHSEVAQLALLSAAQVLSKFFPAGVIVGREFKIGSVAGEKGHSLNFNLDTGLWHDFSSGDKGGDIISLISAHKRCSYQEGADIVRESLGLEDEKKIKKYDFADFAENELSRPAKHPKHGYPSATYEYRDEQGRLLNYIYRFDNGEKKEFSPYSPLKDGKWAWKKRPGSSKLYNLHKLAKANGKAIVLLEGEKAANAAESIFSDNVCTTWPGGVNSINKADLSPLYGREKVLLWPDNDVPGRTCMKLVAGFLKKNGVRKIAYLDIPPEKYNDKWDAADALAQGINFGKELSSYIRIIHDAELQEIPLEEREEGERAVKELLEPAENPLPQLANGAIVASDGDKRVFACLGYNRSMFFFYNMAAKQVIKFRIEALGENAFTALCPHNEWWRAHFPNAKGKVDSGEARDWLVQKCYEAGLYGGNRMVRGRGVWQDGKNLIVNLGKALMVDGQISSDFKIGGSEAIYEIATNPLELDTTKALNEKSKESFLKLVHSVRWVDELSAYHLIGWCVVAPIAGALQWRPHIWINGPIGAGKSKTLEKVVLTALGKKNVEYFLGRSTAAGVEGTASAFSIPVVYDEAETEGQKDKVRIQDLLFFMRLASTESSGRIVKGTKDGGTVEYNSKSCYCLSCVNTMLISEADKSRVTVLSIRGPLQFTGEENVAGWRKFQELAMEVPEDFSSAMFMFSIKNYKMIMDNIKTFSGALATMVSGGMRVGDQLGTLYAGAYSFIYERAATIEEARHWLRKVRGHLQQEEVEQPESSATECLYTILQLIIDLQLPNRGTFRRSIGELLTWCFAENKVDQELDRSYLDFVTSALSRVGIRVMLAQGCFYVANSHSRLMSLLKETTYGVVGWSSLRELPGAKVEPKAVYFKDGTTSRVVSIPAAMLLDKVS